MPDNVRQQIGSGACARGVVGFGALAGAIVMAGMPGAGPVCSIALALIALAALRGCPMCWAVGLIETLRRKRA